MDTAAYIKGSAANRAADPIGAAMEAHAGYLESKGALTEAASVPNLSVQMDDMDIHLDQINEVVDGLYKRLDDILMPTPPPTLKDGMPLKTVIDPPCSHLQGKAEAIRTRLSNLRLRIETLADRVTL